MVFVLIIKSMLKKQQRPLTPNLLYKGSPSNVMFWKYWMNFLQGKYIRGKVYFPVPLHFWIKNSPRGEVLHHLRKKSAIKYLKGTPNKSVKLDKSKWQDRPFLWLGSYKAMLNDVFWQFDNPCGKFADSQLVPYSVLQCLLNYEIQAFHYLSTWTTAGMA